MRELSIKEVEYVVHSLAREWMDWDEPIPDFSSRFPNILESCLAVPFQSFSGRSSYRGLIEKASTLFYLLIKNHPFQNGNKRVAVTALLVFLAENDKWLEVDNQEFYNFTKWVAESNPKYKNQTVSATRDFIKDNLVKL